MAPISESGHTSKQDQATLFFAILRCAYLLYFQREFGIGIRTNALRLRSKRSSAFRAYRTHIRAAAGIVPGQLVHDRHF